MEADSHHGGGRCASELPNGSCSRAAQCELLVMTAMEKWLCMYISRFVGVEEKEAFTVCRSACASWCRLSASTQ